MTLNEYMANTKAEYIKVGAKNGSNFIYCGKPADFWSFKEDFNENEPLRMDKAIASAKKELVNFPRRYKSMMIRAYKEFKKDKINPPLKVNEKSEISRYKNAKEYVHHLILTREMTRENIRKKLSSLRFKRKNFRPLDDRDIIENYKSCMMNKYGYVDDIVIISGYEIGKYWDLDEYENGGEL